MITCWAEGPWLLKLGPALPLLANGGVGPKRSKMSLSLVALALLPS